MSVQSIAAVPVIPADPEEIRIPKILKAVNSCTTQALSEDDVRKMILAAKDKGAVETPLKIKRKEAGLARNMYVTPDGKCRILMTLHKKGGDGIVSNDGSFKVLKKQVVINLADPNAEPEIEALAVCKKKRCVEKGQDWNLAKKDFATEADLLEEFHGQDEVVQTSFFAQEQEKSYLGMELCEGDLLKAIKKGAVGQMTYLQKLDLVRGCALGVAAVHEKGLISRDLKPENFLLKNGQVKLTDLGLACQIDDEDERAIRAGTIKWLPPERASAFFGIAKQMVKATTQTSDLFPLGEIYYLVFNAKQLCFPFQAPANDTSEALIDVMEEVCLLQDSALKALVEDPTAAIPEGMQALIKKMVKCKPEERIATAAAVVAELDALIAAEKLKALNPSQGAL